MAVTMVSLLSGADGAGGQVHEVHERAAHPSGTVDFPVSCSEQAQVEFNRGIALLHHMTYPRAREAFQQVASADPRCAMAHWGIAMTLFQPLWPTRPGPDELQRGWEAVQKGRTLEPPTERERLLVEAASAFFREPESTDYWQRIRRWEQAMERAYAAFPRDPEVTAFYALALLAVAPPDAVSPAHSERAASLLLSVYERNPAHPGAMHYLVHANDAPGRERESLEIVRKYEAIAPRNPHALHMPTHIYTRLGDWEAVISGNRRAATAALEHPAGDRGQYVWDEFPHAIEYLVYAHLQMGADGEAAAQLKRLHGTARLQPTFKTAFHLASTRARYALERHAWSEAMSMAPREPATLDWDRFMWPEAVTWFARGLGAAREGRVEGARAAADRLAGLETAAGRAGEALFARNIRVLRLGVGAWLAHVEHDTGSSVALMREAADLEAATPKHAVTPGPTLPGYELLGDLLLEQARPAEALVAYRRSLDLYPRRFNSLLGAARAARASGDEAAARTFYEALLEVAAGGARRSALDEARAFVARQR
jgi:tetratricopeptide (TPR) repeat protein